MEASPEFSQASEATPDPGYKWRVLASVVIGLFMVILDTTVVNVALKTLQQHYSVSTDEAQWVISLYTLALGIATPLSGFLGDRFGVKRIYLGGLALFAIGSLLCGLAPSLYFLIAARAIEGIGGGIALPLGTELLFRAFPPLVLLIFLFAGLPFAGLELGGFACVCIAFFLNTGAYYGEILRAGIESVPSGQTEAARSTGLGRVQTMLSVVLPQAVRNVLPDLLSNTLEVVKLTSLGSVVAVPELLYQARQAQSLTYNPTPIVVAAIIYFLMLWPLVRLLSRLENRALAGRH